MRFASSLPVLMYHHVSPSVGSLTTSPRRFASQLSWLARRGYTTVGAHEVAEFLAGRPIPAKSIVLTFDDGYLDNWVYAHPALARYNMKALMFVVSGWLGAGSARPVDGMSNLPATYTHAECKQLVQAGDTDAVMARWSEVEAMQAAGTFEIHSHTHTHTRWDLTVHDVGARRAALADDLGSACSELTRRLGAVSDHLCWPQGYFDDDYLAVAREAGFKYFYTTNARGHNLPDTDPAHIYRVAVKNRGGMLFGQRVWLATDVFWGGLYNRWKA